MATDYKLHGVTIQRETLDKETRRTIRHAPQAVLLLWVGKTERPVSIPLDLATLLLLNSQIAGALLALTEKEG